MSTPAERKRAATPENVSSSGGSGCAWLALPSPVLGVVGLLLAPLLVACGGDASGDASEDAGRGNPFDVLVSVHPEGQVLGVRVGYPPARLGSHFNFGLSNDGSRAWLGQENRTIELVTANGQRKAFGSAEIAVWSPDSQYLALLRERVRPFLGPADGTADRAVVPEGVLDGVSAPPKFWIYWSPDSAHVAYEFYRDPQGSAITAVFSDATGVIVTLVASVASRYPDGGIAFSPDGRLVAISRADDVVVSDADGKNAVSIAPPTDTQPVWSADSSLLFVSNRIVAPDGTGAVELPITDSLLGPTWSPTSNTVAFFDGSMIRLWSTEAGVWSAGIESAVDTAGMAWSPDGTKLVYQGENGHAFTAVIDPVHGGEVARFLNPRSGFSWNANGSRFADLTPEGELVIGNPDTGDLFSLAAGVNRAAWLPDGEHLICAQVGRAVLVRADGTDEQAVWSGEGEHEVWFPGIEL